MNQTPNSSRQRHIATLKQGFVLLLVCIGLSLIWFFAGALISKVPLLFMLVKVFAFITGLMSIVLLNIGSFSLFTNIDLVPSPTNAHHTEDSHYIRFGIILIAIAVAPFVIVFAIAEWTKDYHGTWGLLPFMFISPILGLFGFGSIILGLIKGKLK